MDSDWFLYVTLKNNTDVDKREIDRRLFRRIYDAFYVQTRPGSDQIFDR